MGGDYKIDRAIRHATVLLLDLHHVCMSPLAIVNHLLNFAAPALALAVLLVLCGHAFLRNLAKPHGWIAPIAINFVVACTVLGLGLVLLGRDGRMLTYAALVLACASSQWLQLRAWRG